VNLAESQTVRWRRSSFCEGGACAEVAREGVAIAVRNSGDPGSPVIIYHRGTWRDFVARARNGEFDTLG
jgi:hypothetical protein